MKPIASILALLFAVTRLSAAPLSLFDGKTFTGWEGDTANTWRIEGSVLAAGSLEKRLAKSEFLTTTKEFTNFELTLKWKVEGKHVNGGVQFRSMRGEDSDEVSGYQADLGAGHDGELFDESRRKKLLAGPSREVLAEATRQQGKWNDYRIRAEGARIRIWLNGVQTVDYTESDASIARSGIIGLQIHGGGPSIVRYKDIAIEELGAATEKVSAFKLMPRDTVALVGGANFERTRFNAFLQTHLLSAPEAKPLHVRNLAWEGDTVFEQWRDVNFPSLAQQLEQVGATTVLVQFGQTESLGGAGKLPEFVQAYEKLLSKIEHAERRIVLVSPMPFENPQRARMPDLTRHNADARRYSDAVRELAAKRGLPFVNLFTPLAALPPEAPKLTDNGLHLNERGHEVVAAEIARQLGISPHPVTSHARLRTAAVEFERLWFDSWRPMNWDFLHGAHTMVPFSRSWKDGEQRMFPDEMKEFIPILNAAEANITRALAGEDAKPIEPRSSIPTDEPSVKAQTPEEELATLEVHPDYEVNLFASEQDGIGKVVQIRWDERGRLWALCIPDYPQAKPGARPRNKLVICEDTNGDGRADTFKTFADELEMPLGFELGDGGVYLAASTALWHLKDSTGGDHADVRRLVLGGFGTGDTHQTINSLSWGFGGELWFTQGNAIFSRVETPSGIERHDRAGLWRLRPRTGHLDTFFDSSTAGANNWGILTDDFGQVFHKEGAGNGGYYSVPGLVRTMQAVNSKSLNLFVSRAAKTVGFDLIRTRHFPEELQGAVIIGGVYDNTLQLHQFGLKDGAYRSQQDVNIIQTKNKAFRPCDVRLGPDGAVYFADWYNLIVGHYQASYRHPDRDLVHGRIWRVVRKGRPLVQPASLAGARLPSLFEQLDSPERWAKYQAKRLLFARDTGEVTAALDVWVAQLKAGDAKDDYRRLQALAVYEAHETPRAALLQSLLRSPDARIRAYATRTLSTWARAGALPDVLALLEPQAVDDDPIVRLEAIVAASYVPDARAISVAARALDKTFGPYHQHALIKTLHATRPLWSASLADGALRFDKDEHLLFVLQNGGIVNASQLMRQHIERNRDPAKQSAWLKSLATVGNANDLRFVFERGGKSADVLQALADSPASRKYRLADTSPALAPLISGSDGPLRVQAVRLAGVWKVTPLADRIRAIAADDATPLGMRKAALTAMGDLSGTAAVPELLKALRGARSAEVQSVALDALIAASPREAAQQVVASIRTAKQPQDVMSMLKAILSSTEGSGAFGRALMDPKAAVSRIVAPAMGVIAPDKARLTLQALNLIGLTDRKISSLLMGLAGIDSTLPAYTTEYVSLIVRRAQAEGNAAEGRKVFEQTGCIACHAVNNLGGKIGPDLSALSRGLPIDMIVTEVVWPALNVKEGYEAATATMKDGSVITGFKQTDTADSISIRDMTTGEVKTIPHADTTHIKTGGTVMAEGLTAALTEQQLAHLIRYLSELGK
jgi:putative heme-binding domain-containing protein